jgi:hypothetical protein
MAVVMLREFNPRRFVTDNAYWAQLSRMAQPLARRSAEAQAV